MSYQGIYSVGKCLYQFTFLLCFPVMIILFFVFVALMIERIILPKQVLHREVIPPVPHVPRDHLPARGLDIIDNRYPLPNPLELQTEVHTKVRNHGEGPY